MVSTAKSCNVRYNLPSGYSASTLVAAEYANDEMVQVATAQWSDATNSAVVNFEKAPTKGNTVKFMYLADMSSLYPLYQAEEVTVTDEILVLAIGNSFSQDAMYELKNIAAADGVSIDLNAYPVSLSTELSGILLLELQIAFAVDVGELNGIKAHFLCQPCRAFETQTVAFEAPFASLFFLFTVTLLFERPRKDYFKIINNFKIL